MNVLGIDPGQKGGIAFITDFHSEAVPMPMIGKDFDVPAIMEIIRTKSVELVVIEKVHGMPGQGVRSTFTFGYGVGVIVGTVETLGLPLRWVTPQAWKKIVLAGTGKDKDAAIAHVRQAYPGVALVPPRCRTPHDGIADAVCIAEYGRRVFA